MEKNEIILEEGEATDGDDDRPRLSGERLFCNKYRHCHVQWDDVWDSACNDRCPVCDAEIEPYDSEELIPDDDDEEDKTDDTQGGATEEGTEECDVRGGGGRVQAAAAPAGEADEGYMPEDNDVPEGVGQAAIGGVDG